jgi:hypothetical protein
MRLHTLATAVTCMFLLAPAAWADLSDDEIRARLVRQSIAGYPGNCPCPYNVDGAGRSCGKRSAYSKQGGYTPLCYPSDVTEEVVGRYRASLGGRINDVNGALRQ